MSNPNPPPQGDWKDPEYRRQILVNHTNWRLLQVFGPIANSLSEPGIPNNFQRWTNGDKLAFRTLYLQLGEGDRQRLANAFRLHIYERPAGFAHAEEDARYIYKTFLELEKILAKFEPDIRRRWAKKNWDAKKKVIRAAWTNLPDSHRPDLLSLRTVPKLAAGQERDRCRFLFPHMNLEDLATGKTLLRLLNARGRNDPSRFVLSDLDSVQAGLGSKALPFELLEPFAIDMSSDVSSGDYGLIHKAFGYDDLMSILDGSKMGLRDGMFVLEIQAQILVFLRQCCALIMHDKIDKVDDDSIPVQPEPEPLPPHDQPTDGIVWAALERPYMLPQGLVDLPGILNQAKAALEEAQERAWALREDPSFFSTSVSDYMDHSFEKLEDHLGRVHPDVSRSNHFFLNRAVKRLLADVFYSVFEWELMVSLLERVVTEEPNDEYLKARPELQPQDEYFKLLFGVRLFLDDSMLQRVMGRFLSTLLTNPLYRDRFYRPERATTWMPKGSSMDQEPLYWLIMQGANYFRNDEHDAPRLGIDDILIEIQRLVETETQNRELLSPLAVETMGQAGLLADLRSQLKSFRPNVFMPHFGPGFEHHVSRGPLMDEVGDPLLKSHPMMMYKALKQIMEPETFKNLGKYAHSVVGKVPKQRRKMTKESTVAMQQAEAHLDKFWEEFYKAIGEKNEVLEQTIQNITSSVSRQLVRTPDWVELVAKSRPNKGKTQLTVEQALPFGQLSLDPGQDVGVPKSTHTVEKKDKVKTRGVADPSKAEETPVEQEEANAPPPKPVFKLKDRAMR